MNQSSMEVALSAISGEILSRLISFIIKKHTERSCLEEKLERLHHLLLRVHTVVEEAEGRYITNSKMLVQLRMLVDGMYKGYHVLNTFRLKPFEEGPLQEQMHKRPYDTYIYIDNFMFSRVVEKQELINALLQDNFPIGAPAVIPVIGAYRIGKKSLVGYACNDDTVRSHFSSVLHLKSNSFMKIGGETFTPVRTLVVVEFISDVDDSKWVKFYSATLHMGAGSKVVILSRFQEVARFGTVKPILLRSLSQSEFSYLFKVLAFAGTDPKNHPQLESIAMELAENINGLLLVGNMLADLLRTNQNVQFWFHILKRFRNSLERNFSKFGEHPKQLLERDRPTDITMLISPSSAPLHLMPSHDESSLCKKELSKVKFGDLVQDSTTILPKEEFQIIIWESRIPPFTKFIANCIVDKHTCISSDNKKRKSICIQ
ncbi:disease resistance protein RGA2 isoform X1 [Setaria viridis]|uniref:disease resistance protein RGA2 isoform X1 n=1 Tax=Setaria viridis TaxID=4556 RepID=UPI0014938514|nr:uncharacterized protein LOC117836293 isoform X1 [Setaria viridis]